jgi:hypothetical protein
MADIKVLLTELHRTIQTFPYAPRTLVPDLALVGFALDVAESSEAALWLAGTSLPHRAFPNVRAAFESAQQCLLLATDDNYEFAGARAWVHYIQRDAEWLGEVRPPSSGITGPDDARAWYRVRTEEMAAVWDAVCPGRGSLIEKAVAALAPTRGKLPGTWLGVSVVNELEKRYDLLAPVFGKRLSADSVRLNRGIYSALSRETHARWRLDAFAIQHSADGTIAVHVKDRNAVANIEAIRSSVETSLIETLVATAYQRASRQAA